jgi:ubiquinone/menaquinone biosynthesis C-methylase UbiE
LETEAAIAMARTPEPELMIGEEQAYAYSWANFAELNPVMVSRFRESFPEFREGRLLDLGCGTADMTIRFAQAYPEVQALGVDGSEAMLAYGASAVAAAGLSARIGLARKMLPDPELECGAFDAVIANNLLHHFRDPVALWRTASRCARPGSPVMLMDLRRPRTESAAGVLVERYASRAMPVLKEDFRNSLRAAYTVDEVRGQLDAAGLEGFRLEEVGDCQLAAWGRATVEDAAGFDRAGEIGKL